MTKRMSPWSAGLVGLLALPLSALAQTEPAAPWGLNGSDTLETTMVLAIQEAAADGVLPPTGRRCSPPRGTSNPLVFATAACTTDADCQTGQQCLDTNTLVYLGGGSTTAETNIGPSQNRQLIAPMSRNFSGSYLAANPTYAAGIRNIIALDAAILVVSAEATAVRNLNLPLLNSTTAVANDAGTGIPPGYQILGVDPFYANLVEVVLGGVDGSGSTRACSDPRRIRAVLDLAQANNNPSGTISHFYRRDDNSGTTDTFKERVQVGRFCNGRARGILGSNVLIPSNVNLNNQDADPIRRSCNSNDLRTGWKETSCTNLVQRRACRPTEDDPDCTQGLVVALSVGDIFIDVTETMATRVRDDRDAIGFAGRQAIRNANVAGAASAPRVNSRGFSDTNIRSTQTPYLLARRLHLNYADADGDETTDGTTNTLVNVGGAGKVNAEKALYNWMTGQGTTGTDGRCNMNPVINTIGFITCSADCTFDFSSEPNLCNPPFETAASSLAACFPQFTGSTDGGAWAFEQINVASGACCSTGSSPASGVCPAANGRPLNAACWQNSDCASGNCTDALGIGETICSP